MGELVSLAVDGDEKPRKLREVEFHSDPLIEKSFLIVQAYVFVQVDAEVAECGEIAVVELLQQAKAATEGIVMAIFVHGFVAIEDALKFFHTVEILGVSVIQIEIDSR